MVFLINDVNAIKKFYGNKYSEESYIEIEMKDLIYGFFSSMSEENDFPIYNEKSLQFEFGFYLKEILSGSGYAVNVERNVEREPVNCEGLDFDGENVFVKKIVDLYIYNLNDLSDSCAIELKYPRYKMDEGGASWNDFANFTDDIKFMEEVSETYGIDTYCITVASSNKFYDRRCGYAGVDRENSDLFEFYRRKDISKERCDFLKGMASPDVICSDVTYEGGGRSGISQWLKKNKKPGLRNDYDIKWIRLVDSCCEDICQEDGYESYDSCPVYFYVIEIQGEKMMAADEEW